MIQATCCVLIILNGIVELQWSTASVCLKRSRLPQRYLFKTRKKPAQGIVDPTQKRGPVLHHSDSSLAFDERLNLNWKLHSGINPILSTPYRILQSILLQSILRCSSFSLGDAARKHRT